MRMPSRTVGITGASGYVGSVLVGAFAAAGWRVVALVRRPGSLSDDVEQRAFELGEPIGAQALEGLDVLIHAAWDLRAVKPAEIWSRNVAGTRRLFEAAKAAGIPTLIHTSSMSAYEGTKQVYGRAKLECERDVQAAGGLSVRLGLVTGDASGGMSGALRKIARLPVVPLLGRTSHQYLLQEPDLSRVMVAAATQAWKPGVVSAAGPDPVVFGELMKELAPSPRRVFVPIPWRPVYALMRLVEKAGLALPFRSDSVLGLVKPAPFLLAPVRLTADSVSDSRRS
jgi:nucleoside-diphosphate-sugar epimerase